mmetsp:Transcript_38598/g.86811  ORF Transcript_38598/g.86811 Transcript_38598/m.86811 type:complete len:82 (+) Transcript_38598:272-517(+)
MALHLQLAHVAGEERAPLWRLLLAAAPFVVVMGAGSSPGVVAAVAALGLAQWVVVAVSLVVELAVVLEIPVFRVPQAQVVV